MNFIIENWVSILFAIIACAFIGIFAYKFSKMPRESQVEVVKEWLKYAVALAEIEFGSGTGQLKLRRVYDMFITKFPTAAKFIAFEVFSKYVDEALDWLNTQLTNDSIATIVNGNIIVESNTESEVK